jgi:hypothetical protein
MDVSIKNLRLQLFEEHGRHTATVTYQLLGGPDNGDHARYVEKVELLGDDSRPGEDGVDDFLAQLVEVVLLPLADSNRRRTFTLLHGELNEDRSANPNVAIDLFEDEIVARVTVRPGLTPQVIVGKSNVVRRGGPVNKVLATLSG